MITPHIGFMFRVFASQAKVTLLQALYERQIIKSKDFESLFTETERTGIHHHMTQLMNLGLVEKISNDDLEKKGYKMTFKGFEAYKAYSSFMKQVNKAGV